MNPYSLKNIYWLSGILEGEGCFGLSSGSIRIALAMTDEDIVTKAAEILNCPVYKAKKKEGRKQVYTASIFSNKAASWMMTLFPLMGERRKDTIESSLIFWKNQRSKNAAGLGRKNPRTNKERLQNEAIISRYRDKS